MSVPGRPNHALFTPSAWRLLIVGQTRSITYRGEWASVN
jgi:hypothetical protein